MAAAEMWLHAREIATEAARRGGTAAMKHFPRAGIEQPLLIVDTKADDSPVSRADRESEDACKRFIMDACPEDGWLGEETGTSESRSGRTWIVDPIDGTRNFLRGIPLWSTLVACELSDGDGSRIIAGAVYLPALDEMYDAVLRGGARCNGRPIHVSQRARLAESLFCFETPSWFERFGLSAVFAELCQKTALQRGGGDAYYHMLVASGRAEFVVEPSLSVWDVAATSLVVSEAGGRFSDLTGAPDIRAGSALISNGRVHDEVAQVIARLRKPAARA
jgi:histidinol-phosphatase